MRHEDQILDYLFQVQSLEEALETEKLLERDPQTLATYFSLKNQVQARADVQNEKIKPSKRLRKKLLCSIRSEFCERKTKRYSRVERFAIAAAFALFVISISVYLMQEQTQKENPVIQTLEALKVKNWKSIPVSF